MSETAVSKTAVSGTAVSGTADSAPHSSAPSSGASPSGVDAVHLHESIAELHAARGEWHDAYRHVRAALDITYGDAAGVPRIPEQLRREVEQLRREHAEAREQSIRDTLTASYNRRYLDQRLVAMISGAPAVRDGIAVALIDLDWFKQVNDTFGHLIGDAVLRRVVELLADDLPEGGFCARYGGEEFVLVLPGLLPGEALALAEQARARIENHPWSTITAGLRVTVSIGLTHEPEPVAPVVPSRGTHSPVGAEHRMLEADTLLYTAKQSGRNAVAYRETAGKDSDRIRLAGAASDRRVITQAMGAAAH